MENPCGVMVNMKDRYIVVRKIKLLPCYYVRLRNNTRRKDTRPLSHTMV